MAVSPSGLVGHGMPCPLSARSIQQYSPSADHEFFVIRSSLTPEEFGGGVFAGRRKIAPRAQMPQSAPPRVQRSLLRPLCLAMTPQRIASRKWTSAAVRQRVVGSISDLMKNSPET